MPLKYLTVEHVTTKQLVRLFSQITVDSLVTFNGTPCWTWVGFTNNGYGASSIGKDAKSTVHRLFFAWLVHPLPRDQKYGTVDHLCRNRACCNPVHLEFVLPYINFIRGEAPSAINAKKTHCIRGHEFTPENTIAEGVHRHCRICSNDRHRENSRKRSQEKRDWDNLLRRKRYGIRREHFREKNREKYLRRKARESPNV